MIFVYPALVSKNADWKVLPAILKIIERFFLLQLGQAFGSGTLRVKTEWDVRKNRYSELMLERLKVDDDKVLLEIFNQILTEASAREREIENILRKIQSEIDIQKSNLRNLETQLENETSGKNRSSEIKRLENGIQRLEKEIDRLEKDYNRFNQELLAIRKDKKLDRAQREKDRNKGIPEKEKLEKEKRERLEKEKDKYKRHASKVEVVKAKGVSLEPSMMNMDVIVRYIGGPATDDVGRSGDIKTQNISIGCQMAPSIIKNFEEFQFVLLNDYFSGKAQSLFKSLYRDFLRTGDKIIDKIYQYTIGKNRRKISDPNVKKDIILAPQGFVDASSFKKLPGAPKFYNYAAAILVFNKDDITKFKDENIFENQSELQKLFRAGWNSFCVIDNVQEEVLFVSAVDGGFVHKLSFSYIFNALEAKDVYDSLDALRKQASPFQRSIGKISNLGKILAKESALVKSILNYING